MHLAAVHALVELREHGRICGAERGVDCPRWFMIGARDSSAVRSRRGAIGAALVEVVARLVRDSR
jgi:hypothetical protein